VLGAIVTRANSDDDRGPSRRSAASCCQLRSMAREIPTLRQNACAERSLASNSAKTRSRSFVEYMADVFANDASARPVTALQKA
jgi:hypothetical protein